MLGVRSARGGGSVKQMAWTLVVEAATHGSRAGLQRQPAAGYLTSLCLKFPLCKAGRSITLTG